MRLILLLVLILTGCVEPKPKLLFGTVISKIHKPAWTEHYITTDSKNNIQFHTREHPEKWLMTIQENDQEGVNNQRLVDTDKKTFDRLELGHPWFSNDSILEK